MAEINWTGPQLEAIEARNSDILVSAAAGSGKTAVLVERVMRLLTDKETPADISSLVIMTFTKAAASQMKEKIYKGIRKAIANDPANEHLRRQLHEVHNARICTIDSLCMEIVKENFHVVDVDPGFRIADNSEEVILKGDVLKELIEEQYQNPSEAFLELVNFYIDKSDSKLEELIKTLYDFSQSYPEPERWIINSVVSYTGAATNYYDNTDEQNKWLANIGTVVEDELNSLKLLAQEGIRVSNMNYGPYKYQPVFEDMVSFLDSISGEDKIFDLRREAIAQRVEEFWDKPRVSSKDTDEKLKTIGFEIFDEIKSRLNKLYEAFFQQDLIRSFEDISKCSNVAKVLAELTILFSRKYKLAKWERNIADFNDVAHYALKVLIKHDAQGNIIYDEAGEPVYSAVADQMAGEISEIIVDEYQDTNMLQEYIIGALSAKRMGRPDVFMVGDVKQSIYGFRKACPDLFIEKYNRFAEGNPGERRILLNSNFRSRREVLDFTNYIFNQAMVPEVGKIDYTDGHELILGAKYPAPDQENRFIPELFHINAKGKDARNAEAYCIARRIEEFIENGLVTDEKSGELRKVKYSDIAILSRRSNNPEIEQMLDIRGIPAIKISNKGFFECFEIRLLINLLKIIDNPFQDIPFTAVLTSPLIGASGNDLARIKIGYKKQPFSMYKAAKKYAYVNDAQILKQFIEKLEKYRIEASRQGVVSLLDMVLDDCDFIDVINAMPAGEGRKANIELFKTLALNYSKTSYSGLFNFLRYLKQVQDADMDLGEAQSVSSSMNAVKMMTIHKSKGLEFPIVFLVDAAGSYLKKDIQGAIVLDRELGMGIEFRDPVERLKKKTLVMQSIIYNREREIHAEEMRLLYVALTRAKEKLVITSRGEGIDKSIKNVWVRELYSDSQQLNSNSVMNAASYLQLMGRTLISHKDAADYWERAGFNEGDIVSKAGADFSFSALVLDVETVEEFRAGEVFDNDAFFNDIEKLIEDKADQECPEAAVIDYEYPYLFATKMDVKRTASSLENHKEVSQEDSAKPSAKYFRYVSDETGLRGAERGNAYHKLFELLQYDKIDLDDVPTSVSNMIDGLVSEGMLSEEYAGAVKQEHFEQFLGSDIGKRMMKADFAGNLVREQQFVMSIENQGENQLIQGIIDAFFEEDGEIVLVDYKTDRNKSEEEFISTYENQLNAYADALQRATGKKVIEKVIYSVELGKSISF